MSKLTTYKLKDICSFIRGTKIDFKNKNQNTINKYPIINNINSIEFYNDTYNRDENTILINLMGKSGHIMKCDNKIFLTQHFYSIHSKDKDYLNEEYLFHYLINIQDKIYNIRKGPLLTYICLDEIKNMDIHIPSVETQKEIIKQIQKNNKIIQNLENEIKKIKINNKEIINEQ